MISSLDELDALVGRSVTGEIPKTYWEDSYSYLQCSTFEEALEALHDPYFQQFTPEEQSPDTVLREVKLFSKYSSSHDAVAKVVQKIGVPATPLKISSDGARWSAAFGEQPPVQERTMPLAICLAALRLRGIEVELNLPSAEAATSGSLATFARW